MLLLILACQVDDVLPFKPQSELTSSTHSTYPFSTPTQLTKTIISINTDLTSIHFFSNNPAASRKSCNNLKQPIHRHPTEQIHLKP
ncbi:hypothetical protein KC19_8G068100 [Ceratodon purpureus]|uniref:Uncharacterized protein n=1 Tax=Ceratodon purpureus TaxID=3225 RepID=A0A8T0H0H6_CERPU|nr:hypothetical protein KC19_8G068100 [Ceratodon purpureus]